MQFKNGGAPTTRDGGNASIIIFTQIILMWLLNDCLGLPVPREVAGAFGGLIGYFGGRYLRY